MLERLGKTLLYGVLFFVCLPVTVGIGALILSVIPEGTAVHSKALYAGVVGVCAAFAFGLPKFLGDFIVKCWQRKRDGLPVFEKQQKSENVSIIRREYLEKKDVSIHKDQTDVCESYSSNMMQKAGWWTCDQCGRENASYTSSCACGNPKKKSS